MRPVQQRVRELPRLVFGAVVVAVVLFGVGLLIGDTIGSTHTTELRTITRESPRQAALLQSAGTTIAAESTTIAANNAALAAKSRTIAADSTAIVTLSSRLASTERRLARAKRTLRVDRRRLSAKRRKSRS